MMKDALIPLLMTSVLAIALAYAEDENPAIEPMLEVFDFIPYSGGNIFVEAIPETEWEKYFIIDARSTERYTAGHIEDATNIEWRSVLSEKDKIPTDKPVLLYCDTGSLSSQAAFALRVSTGREDVLILNKGYEAYKAHMMKTKAAEGAKKVIDGGKEIAAPIVEKASKKAKQSLESIK